jgi:CheY-like chemotaxis protein
MKTCRILLGNSENLLNDFIEALFREVCQGRAAVECTRTAQIGEFGRVGCQASFDLAVVVPAKLRPELSPPTPMGHLGEGLRVIRAIKSKQEAPIIAIVGHTERARYEPLLLEAGADCVLELPFHGDQLTSAVTRLLRLPARLEHFQSNRWFFAGVLMRGLRLLSQA